MVNQFPKNLHLLLSGFIVIAAGLVYGFNSPIIMPLTLGFEVEALSLKNIFWAIMGIYIGIGVFWLMGAFSRSLWKAATICNVLFMGGIALGRLISLSSDGIHPTFIIATFLELTFMTWGLYNLKNYHS